MYANHSLNFDLIARHDLLASENPGVYYEYRHSYIEFYQPANNVELDLVDQIVATAWNIRRAEQIEVALLDMEIESHAEEICRKFRYIERPGIWAIAFKGLDHDHFQSLGRHLDRLHRRYIELMQRLEAIQSRPALRFRPSQKAA
ncbi:MAG: hypothetical protein SFV51_24245 [Bryobacteraceae bacterium]|nr:hypothetical protein [Bryobacteraceae bacterium]